MPSGRRPAPLLRRALATFLDLGLLALGGAAVAPFAGLIFAACLLPYICYGSNLELYLLLAVFAVAAIGALIPLAYLVVFWSRGATIGMRATGLVLVAADGRPPRIGRALLRALVLSVTVGALVLLAPFGPALAVPVVIAFAALRRDRRAPHDLLAGTSWVRGGPNLS